MNPPFCPYCNIPSYSLTTPLEYMCRTCLINAAIFARSFAIEFDILMQRNRQLMAEKQHLVAENLRVFASSSSQIQKEKDPRYKTDLCEKWEKNTECEYGEKCIFAHGIGELRDKEICIVFQDTGNCPRANFCPFRH